MEMPMLLDVEQFEKKLYNQSFVSLSDIGSKISADASGFYWIYSTLSFDKFKNAVAPKNSAHVNFAELAKLHEGLKHVIPPSDTEPWCIYNGKGKKLRNRILAEFTNTKGKTGKLALRRCFEDSDFKIKYVVCDDTSPNTGVLEPYSHFEKHFERAWRLHVGWPFLCRA
jgi:hypothetical protein